MTAIRILGRQASINVRKVLWAAAEAGVPFEYEPEWGQSKDLKGPEFLGLNPNGQVPIAITAHGPIWESNTICRFVCQLAGRKDLLPDEPHARAQIEKWMDWQATELNYAWRPPYMTLVRGSSDFSHAQVEASLVAWNELMLRLDRQLGITQAFVAGDTFTIADVVIGVSLQRWLLSPIERPPAPHLEGYRARLLERPAMQAWTLPTLA